MLACLGVTVHRDLLICFFVDAVEDVLDAFHESIGTAASVAYIEAASDALEGVTE